MRDGEIPGLPGPTRLQRVDGAARIAFKAAPGGATVLDDLYQRAPARVLFPDVDRGEPPQAVLLTTSGGLTGGDRLSIDAAVGPGAAATFATQAAEKLYKAREGEGDTHVSVTVSVGPGAWGEWLAQETILFDGARLRRSLTADLAPDARLLATESVVLGRAMHGESLRTGFLHDSWRVRRGGRLVWADALTLSGDIPGLLAQPFGFGGAIACGTLLYAGPDAASHLDRARDLLAPCLGDGLAGGATCLDGLLVVRLLADSAITLRRGTMAVASGLRAAAGGLPARLPRVWTC